MRYNHAHTYYGNCFVRNAFYVPYLPNPLWHKAFDVP